MGLVGWALAVWLTPPIACIGAIAYFYLRRGRE
jgi:hypothetical protein